MMLYIKDRFDVSGRAYHEMAKVCKEMPLQVITIYHCRKPTGEIQNKTSKQAFNILTAASPAKAV